MSLAKGREPRTFSLLLLLHLFLFSSATPSSTTGVPSPTGAVPSPASCPRHGDVEPKRAGSAHQHGPCLSLRGVEEDARRRALVGGVRFLAG